MLMSVEHEKRLITSGPALDCYLIGQNDAEYEGFKTGNCNLTKDQLFGEKQL